MPGLTRSLTLTIRNSPRRSTQAGCAWPASSPYSASSVCSCSVDYAGDADWPERSWVRVRLLDEWDIAGSEVEQLGGHFAATFGLRYVPEFRALSLDQRVLMHTTVWGNGTVSTIAIRPE